MMIEVIDVEDSPAPGGKEEAASLGQPSEVEHAPGFPFACLRLIGSKKHDQSYISLETPEVN